tara:strand:+ start:371 stop:1105 length:735 start_codon:yes stop_codon:yes gene_type:complete
MAGQGQIGTIEAYTDFTGAFGDTTWGTGEVPLEGGWGFVSVNEGTLNTVVDESGGVLQFLTDTGDNDNVCLLAGKFDPSKGTCTIEARFKIADAVTLGAIYCGFTETMALDTPVMPAEFDTATMTYNGSGGMVGLLWDPDATTNKWKALAGDGGAASNSTNYGTNGTDATDIAVNDEYDIVKVSLSPSGFAQVWHEEELVASGQTGLTTTDLFYAVLMCENRSAAAEEFEVDYVYAATTRDWTV